MDPRKKEKEKNSLKFKCLHLMPHIILLKKIFIRKVIGLRYFSTKNGQELFFFFQFLLFLDIMCGEIFKI